MSLLSRAICALRGHKILYPPFGWADGMIVRTHTVTCLRCAAPFLVVVERVDGDLLKMTSTPIQRPA